MTTTTISRTDAVAAVATVVSASSPAPKIVPVALYIPNLLCYTRVVTAFLGLHYSRHRPWIAIWIWIFSAGLDLFDGILARALHQTSTLGIFLDICADNILRTCIWMAAMLEHAQQQQQQQQQQESYVTMIACIVVSTEWLTMVSTQLHSAKNDGYHWKTARLNDPWLVRKVFQGGFQGSPLGVWTIYGLFAAPLFLWISAHPPVLQGFSTTVPFFHVFKYAAYSGRAFGFGIEMYLTCSYLSHVIDEDTERRDDAAKKES